MPDHYSQLLEWRRLEGSVRGLAKLPVDFYTVTQAYLADQRRVYESELRENPSSRKGELARQTFQRATQVARDIVEARMTKLLSAAFNATAGGSREIANALPEERQLFEGLVRLLKEHRQVAAPFLEPSASTPTSPEPPERPTRPPVEASPPRVEAPQAAVAPAMVYVKVTRDGRPVETGGETIDLRKEDVLTLPEETAEILVRSKLAERLGPDERRSIT
jgi:DNA replication initiation complex subunit (GINS family)